MCGRRLGSSRYYNISYLAKSSLLKNLLTILPASLLGYRPNRITRMSPLMSKDVLLVQLSFYLNCMSDAIFHKFSIGYCNLALYFICIVWTYVVCTLFVLLGSGLRVHSYYVVSREGGEMQIRGTYSAIRRIYGECHGRVGAGKCLMRWKLR